VLSFTATPPTILPGQPIAVVWSSTNATSCIASGGWSGSQPLACDLLEGGARGGPLESTPSSQATEGQLQDIAIEDPAVRPGQGLTRGATLGLLATI
jgi:hypothetical protein